MAFIALQEGWREPGKRGELRIWLYRMRPAACLGKTIPRHRESLDW